MTYIICILYVYFTYMKWRFVMHINLSPEMERYLERKVSEGFYSNASEVVRDAIRRMKEDDKKIAAFQAAVRKGDEQLRRGEGVLFTPELLQKITDDAYENSRKGKKINPEVTG